MTHGIRPSIVRFGATERMFHWCMALPYLTLMSSGGLLLAQRRIGRAVFPEEALVDVHIAAAALFVVLPSLVFLGGDRAALIRNVREALAFGRDDFDWLLRSPVPKRLRRRPLPPCGKFNPGQKVNLVCQMILALAFIGSGAWLYFEPEPLLPWLGHVAAFFAAIPLVGGHLYLALLNPGTRKALAAVFTGRVPLDYAFEHHPLWARSGGGEEGAGGDRPPVRRAPATERTARPVPPLGTVLDAAGRSPGRRDEGADVPVGEGERERTPRRVPER